MNMKAVLAVPQWWCFAGNHQPVVRVGDAFVQIDFERIAQRMREGLNVCGGISILLIYFIYRNGDWSMLWGVPFAMAGFCLLVLFLQVSSMRSIAGAAVYEAFPVPFVEYDIESMPKQFRLDIGESDDEATILMREMWNMAWHIPLKWWLGLGSVVEDISSRFGEEDIRDWLRRRDAYIINMRALQRKIASAK